MQSEITTAIIAAVVGAVSGGIVNFILELIKNRRSDKKETQRKKEEVYKTRPELDIIDYEDHIYSENISQIPSCDIEVFVAMAEQLKSGKDAGAVYKQDDLVRDNWHVFTYKFKNMGNTDIDSLNLIMSVKNTVCLFETKLLDYMASKGVINYSICYDKKIRVGETVSLKLIYNNQRIPKNSFSSIMVIGLQDDSGHCWEQPFFAPDEKIYKSTQVSNEFYHCMLRSDDMYDKLQKIKL